MNATRFFVSLFDIDDLIDFVAKLDIEKSYLLVHNLIHSPWDLLPLLDKMI
jgi:hypothetical protein